jgi:hypothetical protein
MIFFKKYALHLYNCRWDKLVIFLIDVSNEIFYFSARLRIRLFKYFTDLKIFDHIFVDKFVFICIVLVLIINIFSNRSILSFWNDVYETNRFVTISRNFINSRYSNLRMRSSFIVINRTIWSYLIRVVFRNSRIIERTSFFREWI